MFDQNITLFDCQLTKWNIELYILYQYFVSDTKLYHLRANLLEFIFFGHFCDVITPIIDEFSR